MSYPIWDLAVAGMIREGDVVRVPDGRIGHVSATRGLHQNAVVLLDGDSEVFDLDELEKMETS